MNFSTLNPVGEMGTAREAEIADFYAADRIVDKKAQRQLLTHSRCNTFKTCRRKEFWAYECRIRTDIDSRALRMGHGWHEGLDCLRQTACLETACETIRSIYSSMPPQFDSYDWEIERETLVALLAGYDWRWSTMKLKVITSEQSFQVRLRNPATGAASTEFDLAGKIDGIVELEDGRLAVLESKTVSESLDDDSDFWRRLQLDQQISTYIHGAREIDWSVDCVLYDVARKPTIQPTSVAVCDDLGAKIVLDQHGQRVRTERGQWRQTGDKEKGYTLQTRVMTPDEWSKKLLQDISERPNYYFARREIPRLDSEIVEFIEELWDIQKSLRDAQNNNRWYRTVTRDTCPFCPYFSLCTSKYDSVTGELPESLSIVNNIHPELS